MHTCIPRGLAVAALLALAGPALARDNDDERLRFVPSSLSCQRYDGASDDLLTAGLGKTGLREPGAPRRSPHRRARPRRSCAGS